MKNTEHYTTVYNFCTLSDYNYLHFGLALFESLQQHASSFHLYYLCLDKKAYDTLVSMDLDSLTPIFIGYLEDQDGKLLEIKNAQPSREALIQENYWNKTENNKAAKAIQYFWVLASYFSWYLLKTYDIDHIVYADSDIFFFDDCKNIFDEVGERSIGLVSHRLTKWSDTRVWGRDWASTTEKDDIPDSGYFNVGVVYFKNDDICFKCVETWKDWLLDPNNEYYEDYGTIGDQRYLMLFIPLFGRENVKVMESIGHLAPWNVQNHRYNSNSINWLGQDQSLTYYHFSNFAPNFSGMSYEPAPRHGNAYGLVNITPFLRKVHDKYFLSLLKSKEKLDEISFRNDSL